jgi:hypothetical protein
LAYCLNQFRNFKLGEMMATDWLKVEVNTPDKPEVFALAARMKWDDLDLAVGKLIRLWRWFDQHTQNGDAPGVTAFMLDHICNAPGFAEALMSVGWLQLTPQGAFLPNFDLHNGKTAKQRALTARRMQALRTHRNNGDGSGVTLFENSDDANVTVASTSKVKNKTLSIEGESKVKGFIRPTLEEISREVASRGNKIDPEQFFNFYESKGWKVGNQSMKNWRAAIATWEKREKKPKSNSLPQSNHGLDMRRKAAERLAK